MTADLEPPLTGELTAALMDLAGAPRIVVAFDFDGTLAPLVDDPDAARAIDGAIPALEILASQPGVTAALVSGRDLATLSRLSDAGGSLVLIGSHGAQWSSVHDSTPLTEAHRATYAALQADLDGVRAAHPGSRIETKPAALVLHTRGMSGPEASAVYAEAEAMLAGHPEVHTTPGKDVLEMSVLDVGKGPAIVQLAERHGAEAVFFAGDDVTDERAFTVLGDRFGPRAVTVKVGPGTTGAAYRIPDEAAALATLRLLASLRG